MPKSGVEIQRYSFFRLGARWGWVVKSHAQAALPPGKRPGTHCAGCWEGPGAACGQFRLHRVSIPGPSSSQRVAIPTEITKQNQIAEDSKPRLNVKSGGFCICCFAYTRGVSIRSVTVSCFENGSSNQRARMLRNAVNCHSITNTCPPFYSSSETQNTVRMLNSRQ